MELKFRRLDKSEIEVRVGSVNNGGVQLLLFADARVYFAILDEAVTPTRWQRHHSRDNANCVVSIWDEDLAQWVEKEDTGTASSAAAEKGTASDSFKRACTCWGIGRELYTAPNLFIKKDKLPHYVAATGNTKAKCDDSFFVQDVKYTDSGAIASITIAISYYGNVSGTVTFTANGGTSASSAAQQNSKAQGTTGAPKVQNSGATEKSKTQNTPQTTPPPEADTKSELTDTDISVLYAKGELAGTSKDGIAEWVQKQFGVESVSALTRVQYDKTCAALDKQAEKKKGA